MAHSLHRPGDESMPNGEIRRRLMWACYCIDIMVTGKQTELASFSLDRIAVQLPMDERSFMLRTRATTRIFRLPWTPATDVERASEGLPAQGVMLFAISQSVLK